MTPPRPETLHRVRALARVAMAVAALLLALAPASAAAKTPHKAFWLKKVTITEYWPAPEEWFIGKRVRAPGLGGKHRIDWLYSAGGVSMQGEGIGLDGKRYHISALGSGGWIDANGRSTRSGGSGPLYWRAGGYWKNRKGRVTFPLQGGGWSRGKGRHYVKPPHGISFAPGSAKPLKFWKSLAVDPRTIPMGSRVYIPAYKGTPGHGWFRAEDTGGAVIGRHVDVYRSPPASRDEGGSYRTGQRIKVIPPK